MIRKKRIKKKYLAHVLLYNNTNKVRFMLQNLYIYWLNYNSIYILFSSFDLINLFLFRKISFILIKKKYYIVYLDLIYFIH